MNAVATRCPTSLEGWFKDTRVRFDPEVEGNRVFDDGMVLGMKAGPEYGDMGSLLHEMAHLVEIDDERCLVPGWGLRVTAVEVDGFIYEQPSTFGACLREVRAMAIQFVIGAAIGFRESARELAELLWYVPGLWHGFRHYGVESRDMTDIYGPIAEDIERRAGLMSLDQVWAEWRRKCALHDAAFGKGDRHGN